MEFSKLFVVYDPTRQEQPALDRGAAIAQALSVNLHLYACIHDISADSEADEWRLLSRQKDTLNQVVTPLRGRGINVTIEVEWDADWYQRVVRAAHRNRADLVLKSSYPHSSRERILKKTSDWTLIRECRCPVLLVKQGESHDLGRVLAAVDIRKEHANYEKLNEQIIDFSKQLLVSRGAEVHFVNAFKNLKSAPDRSVLEKSCGVESDRIHIRMGEPEEVIVEGARELEASLVVVGNSARSGLSAVFKGNTVEKVLDKLDCDVLSMP